MRMELTNLASSDEYRASEEPRLVELKPANFLTIEGMGAPDGEQFKRRMAALEEVHRALRKKLQGAGNAIELSYLEGQWWGVSGPGDFSSDPTSDWAWRLMFRVPDLLNQEDVNQVISELRQSSEYSEVAKVRLKTIREGLSVQILHIGSYMNEKPSIDKMSEFIQKRELSFHGLHHEIYLNSPKDVPVEELRTILRMPVC
jgi:hypothetical protein